jgi:16S rRNA (cytidine1402-2'-O)-methyltransferase
MEGKKIAVVSDAGTPCISDPGSILVEAAVAAGIPVEGVCGANAAVTALSISGFKFVSFSFYGFLPRSSREIKDSFGSFAGTDIPVAVYFESPNRIKKTMSILEETLPDASVCLCNDLTKKYERIYRGSPSTVLESLDNNEFSEKGEYTLVVYHPRNRHDTFAPQQVASDVTDEALLVDYMIKHGCSLKQAITGLAKESVRPKKALYAASLQLKALFNDNLDEGDKFGQ